MLFRSDDTAPEYNPLYDSNGDLKDPSDVIDFFEAVIEFYNAWNSSSLKSEINSLILTSAYCIDLSNGIQLADLTGLGRNDQVNNKYNPLYDSNGDLRDPADTIDFFEAVVGFYNAWNSSSLKSDISTLILSPVYSINLNDGINETELAAFGKNTGPEYNPLYDLNGDLKDPNDVIDFFEAVVGFYNAWNSSSLKSDISSVILNPIYGINLNDGIQLSDLTAFGDDTGPEYNPLYDSNGDLRDRKRRVGKECRSRWSPYH